MKHQAPFNLAATKGYNFTYFNKKLEDHTEEDILVRANLIVAWLRTKDLFVEPIMYVTDDGRYAYKIEVKTTKDYKDVVLFSQVEIPQHINALLIGILIALTFVN
jgi:hypothetical protein